MTLAKIEHLALCNRCLKVKAYSSEREVAHACDYGSADSICQCGGKRCCCSHCQQVIRFLDSGLFKEAEAEIQHIIKGEVIACWSREQGAQIVANTCSCQGTTILYGSWRCPACGQERRPS
ncbi:hypothetical protein AYI98_00860 [Shewanella algae]|uniref:hypothetical protein n=1 Tax=Shewanella algae TaxID=38313 RepID=UPI001183141B|nr:hypothetical protein [Shewanella algae]TVL53729.1 hypothetical protein AYI98_00860 [Shewanella algae]